jgi:uncharacterized repeat protein (TIGR03803 family)
VFRFQHFGAAILAAAFFSASSAEAIGVPRNATSGVASSASEGLLHSFLGVVGGGTVPSAGLISEAQGNLYGSTSEGGAFQHGTAFKLTPPPAGQTTWKETVLHAFGGVRADGKGPLAALLADASGSLYGTTTIGGANNRGTVFKLTPPPMGKIEWTESVLYSFAPRSTGDGFAPAASLIMDTSGNLYGTTSEGGDTTCGGGCGTVFKLAPPTPGQAAWTESILYR